MALIIKNREQIDGIRKSCHLARKALKYIAPFISEGVTTKFIDQKISEFIKNNGAKAATLNYKGYPASCCISVNDVVCHGVPDQTILKNGDIVNVDVTTILNGYYGDTCMMYRVGAISQDAEDLITVTKRCLDLGIEQCYPGNHLGNIGFVIAQYAQSHGYSVVYQFCGHGVGIKFHEDPEVSHIADRNSGIKLKPGMTFTIEPMINQGKARSKVDKKDGWTARTIDGKLSAQFEHTILITETGVEVLTDIDEEYDEKGKLRQSAVSSQQSTVTID
jgi:methionyl aminopeptidase